MACQGRSRLPERWAELAPNWAANSAGARAMYNPHATAPAAYGAATAAANFTESTRRRSSHHMQNTRLIAANIPLGCVNRDAAQSAWPANVARIRLRSRRLKYA